MSDTRDPMSEPSPLTAEDRVREAFTNGIPGSADKAGWTHLRSAVFEVLATLDAARTALAAAERALIANGFRKSCTIPACNCGDRWGHGGHAAARLSEIGEELGVETQGVTLLNAVKARGAARDAAVALAEARRVALENAMRYGIELGTGDPEWVAEARAALAMTDAEALEALRERVRAGALEEAAKLADKIAMNNLEGGKSAGHVAAALRALAGGRKGDGKDGND